jgi:AcrR family transcriptional regulator
VLIERAAARLFAERGYDGTSYEAIAESAGITRAVLYDHFPSKAALQATLLRTETERLLRHVQVAVLQRPGSPKQQLRAGVHAFFEFVEEHPFAWRMIFRDAPADPELASTHREIHQLATRTIAEMLAAGASTAGRRLAAEDPRVVAFAEMLKVAQNSLAARWWDERTLQREQLADWVVEFCWNGLERALARAPKASRK